MTHSSLGATLSLKSAEPGVAFAVASDSATRVWVSIFGDGGTREDSRHELVRTSLAPDGDGTVFSGFVPGLTEGIRYGFRADGEYAPERGLWFDPDKLLMDAYAVEIDRPYVYDARLAARRGEGHDTAPLMPKAVVRKLPQVIPATPLFDPRGLIYEVPVRAFTMLHPDISEALRGTVAALAHPVIIAHLRKLNVSAVELMPITAWIDERHLPPLGLRNAWGYNPVSFMALDPRLAPGGMAELRDTVAALHEAGIGVILDLVFNHTGESDALGPTLSLRGLDNQTYYRHVAGEPGTLANDTGTGNTVACNHPIVQQLVLDSLRHFVVHAGVDGFRFDLAPVLGRGEGGYDPNASMIKSIQADAVVGDRVLIAEPWDIGDGGYQLGNFPVPFLEWNDRYRDDVRRFWRGDRGMIGALATRLAGSSDVFAKGGAERTRTVNFVAAHDGMTLADIFRYERKHNEDNGELNRDGHSENLSWNNGVEGATENAAIVEARRRDAFAVLSTLFVSRGAIQLTAGDEFGRSQNGNNNAYAQDNQIGWVNWATHDAALQDHVAALAAMRTTFPMLSDPHFLSGASSSDDCPDVEWLSETGQALDDGQWNDPERRRLTMVLTTKGTVGETDRLAVLINGDRRSVVFTNPARAGNHWQILIGTQNDVMRELDENGFLVHGRSVVILHERPCDAINEQVS